MQETKFHIRTEQRVKIVGFLVVVVVIIIIIIIIIILFVPKQLNFKQRHRVSWPRC